MLHVLFSHPQRVVCPETKKININQNKFKGVGWEKPINDQAGRAAKDLHHRGFQETPADLHKVKIRGFSQGPRKRIESAMSSLWEWKSGRDNQLDGFIFI